MTGLAAKCEVYCMVRGALRLVRVLYEYERPWQIRFTAVDLELCETYPAARHVHPRISVLLSAGSHVSSCACVLHVGMLLSRGVRAGACCRIHSVRDQASGCLPVLLAQSYHSWQMVHVTAAPQHWLATS